MGWTDLFKPKPPSLAQRVESITLEKMDALWEHVRDKPYHTDMVFCSTIMAGAGHFITQCFPRLKPLLGKTSPDIIALEALAFNQFAIRAVFPKGKFREDELIDEGFRIGGLQCLELANARLSPECTNVFFPRVFQYRNIAKSSGMQGAVEHFTNTIFQSSGSKLPQLDYGVSIERYSMELAIAYVSVMAFATTMPSGIADSLKLYLDDADVLNRTWPPPRASKRR